MTIEVSRSHINNVRHHLQPQDAHECHHHMKHTHDDSTLQLQLQQPSW